MKLFAKNIGVRLGDFALRGVSFSLGDGENLAIVGASGCGKSALARVLCGQLCFEGELVFEYDDDVGLLPQAVFVEQRQAIVNRITKTDVYYQLRYNSVGDEVFSVFEELKFVLDDELRIDFLLKELSISYLKYKPLVQLSSGELKRFQLARALLRPAQLLVLDEPFAGLDAGSRVRLRELLDGVARSGAKIVVVASERDELPSCVGRVLDLGGGDGEQVFCVSSLPLLQSFFESGLSFENAILMRDVSVRYGDKVILNNINWRVRKGERWLLKGKNGAGKSMLMSLVVADNPQAYCNEIYLFDRRRGSGESVWDVKRNIGFVSPELCAFFDKNVCCLDAVASGFLDSVGVFEVLPDRLVRNARDWLKAFGLGGLAKRRLADVSSGMQRVVLLIRALVKNPPLLILDEPCQGLDERHVKAFVKLVDDICRQTNSTLVYISHYEDEVPSCVSHTLELYEDNGEKLFYIHSAKEQENDFGRQSPCGQD